MKLFQWLKKETKQDEEPMETTCFDKMDYYYEKAEDVYRSGMSDREAELTEADEMEIQRRAGNHIGFFMTWIIKHHFEGEEAEAEAVEAVRNEKMLGVDYFLDYCDGKFWKCDVSESIYPFVNQYYDQYFSEYSSWVVQELCDLPLEFIGSWEDYHDFEHILNDRFALYNKS